VEEIAMTANVPATGRVRPAVPRRRTRTGALLRRLGTAGLIAGMAGGLTLGASITLHSRFAAAPAAPPVSGTDFQQMSSTSLAAGIGRLQRHLREQQKDATGWATLGLSYVEQARLTADPTYYPKASASLAQALRVRPSDNDAAHAGLAALAAARHDFGVALAEADRSLAINPYGARALAVRVDALVELGRYPEARTAAEHADRVAPGIPAFTRLAYVNELYGKTDETRRILSLAASSASDPGDAAYVHAQLGELAWSRGDVPGADREFSAALRADPSYLAAVDGRGRVRAATGDLAGALADRKAVVARLPLPGYLTSYGELLDAAGRHADAAQQYAVAGTWVTLARASGVATDLETALFAADHGDKGEALRAARAEWARRHGVQIADALAWALHVNGKDAEALQYATQAGALGYRNASFRYHRGMIEKSLGRTEDARRDLTAALRLNPNFSALHAPSAKAALTSLGGAR
jgi:tetratricopeptide (TPR) repeat protein